MIKIEIYNLQFDPTWDYKTDNTTYLTHDIHYYPAKFIPQIARRLIEEYSSEGDIILDPFVGSGTTLLEARLSNRNAIGVDLNPIAYIVSYVKSNPFPPNKLQNLWNNFYQQISDKSFDNIPLYSLSEKQLKVFNNWIPLKQLMDMRKLFYLITTQEDKDFSMFLTVAFSHIQKKCSWWNMKSIKPLRDFNKNVPDVRETFIKHINKMIRKNNELYKILENNNTCARVIKGNAKYLSSFLKEQVDMVLFSPPYATSYEYLDVHKLSVLWLEDVDFIKELKKEFIGTKSISNITENIILPGMAIEIFSSLKEKDKRLGVAVEKYFYDMWKVFKEIQKIIKYEKYITIVIGNTSLRGVYINNAQVFIDMMEEQGYKIEKVIKRRIWGKNLPSTRDPKTGKFISVKNKKDIKHTYKYEFIIVGKWQG